ncbi:MAG TPA: AtpZ/AtpI family protein [Candidatus Ozemobacteraceae bacterium]|nr:AtpZ/AtpI family protein [Candidatus Ozemobacteraceae bacterium]
MERPQSLSLVAGAFADVANLISLGVLAGTCIGFGLAAGWLVDYWFSLHPYGILGGIMLGLASAVRESYRMLRHSIECFERRKQTAQSR